MYDVINPSIFPKNQQDAEALVTAAAYSPFTANRYDGLFHSNGGSMTMMGELGSDIGDIEWAGMTESVNVNYTVNTNTTGQYKYVASFSKMTLTLERIAGVDMPQSVKDRLIAEIHCGKGWLGYLLYDWFGPVPIAPLEILNEPLADQIVPRLSKEEMVSFIETELKEAIKVLPANYKKGDSNYGRFTRGLAYTALMRLYMHESDWAKAEECGRELMKEEYGYALMPEYADIFTLENEKNAEIIWAVQCTRDGNMALWHVHTLPGT
jgi:hypothetical protein